MGEMDHKSPWERTPWYLRMFGWPEWRRLCINYMADRMWWEYSDNFFWLHDDAAQ